MLNTTAIPSQVLAKPSNRNLLDHVRQLGGEEITTVYPGLLVCQSRNILDGPQMIRYPCLHCGGNP